MDRGAKYGGDLNLEATELRLGLPGRDLEEKPSPKGKKRDFSDAISGYTADSTGDAAAQTEHEHAPASKIQLIGWPPIRSFRKNNLHTISKKKGTQSPGIYVKVSIDGAPYLRKIDLKTYRNYQDLLKALNDMFSCFTIGEFASRDGSEYVTTYEDKDGDLMLVGDVPWEMFISSCKRLRIMKGPEAKGFESECFKCMTLTCKPLQRSMGECPS